MTVNKQELLVFIKYMNRASELMSEFSNPELDQEETIRLFKTLIHQIELDEMLKNLLNCIVSDAVTLFLQRYKKRRCKNGALSIYRVKKLYKKS